MTQDNRISKLEMKVENLVEKVRDMAAELKGVRTLLLIGFAAVVGVDLSGVTI